VHAADPVHRVAKLMNINTVVEHVEDQKTLDTLHELGIDYAQSFYLSPPMPIPDVLAG
jgi:ammonium transporter, Amt family